MDFKTGKKHLLRALARSHAVADRKSSMPILSNVLIEATKPENIRFAATDLYLGITATSPGQIDSEGAVAVSARTIFDIVKNLPEGDVRVQGDENSITVSLGKVRYKIPSMQAKDFPKLPAADDLSYRQIDTGSLNELIRLTQYSMSSDDTRPHLAGALFESEQGRLRMVTTDGHRLSKSEVLDTHNNDAKFSVLIPNKGILELRRVIDDIKSDQSKGSDENPTIGFANTSSHAFFQRDGLQLSVKLGSEAFPPYAKVIPQSNPKKITLNRALFSEALRRISLVASDKSGGVRFDIAEGLLKITSENPDVGEGIEEIDIDYTGDSVIVGFNARYMLDVLGALHEDDVSLELGGELDPGVIRPVGDTDFVGVVMPMRI